MKLIKRALSLTLAGVMALGLTACGGAKSAGDVLAQAQKNNKEVSSMNAKMVMQMDMTVEADGVRQSTSTVSTIDMSMFSDPLKMHIEIGMEVEGQSQSLTMYAQEEEGAYKVYVSDGSMWASQAVGLEDLEQYDAAGNMTLYLDSSTNLQEAGSEEINGVDTYKYIGVVSGDEMSEVLERSGALDSLGSLASLGMDESQLNGLIQGLSDMPITVWIDKESYYPVRYEMDMTQLMRDMLDGIFSALGSQLDGLTMEVDSVKVSMDCSDFNKVEDFEIPQEALAS